MIIAFTFRAKPGKQEEMQALLDNPGGGERVAKAMGAKRNLLLWKDDRMVRILEFEDGVEPVPLGAIAKKDEKVHAFLKQLGALTEPGFDPDDEKSMQGTNEQAGMRVLYDVRV